MPFQKGLHSSLNTEFKKGQIPWAKLHPELMKSNSGSFKKGNIPYNKNKKRPELSGVLHPMYGRHQTKDAKKIISMCRKDKHNSLVTEFKKGCHYSYSTEFKNGFMPWNKGKKFPQNSGPNSRLWIDGRSLDKNYIRKRKAERYLKFKNAGRLSLKTIQLVYEDNIKKFGTLTCYLCLKPIEFKQDTLEHKIPLIRGGTNLRENLDIAHRSCNSRKHSKTEIEYREVIKNG